MSIKLNARRLKWHVRGLMDQGFKDFRRIGLGCTTAFEDKDGRLLLRGWVYAFGHMQEQPVFEAVLNGDVVFSKPIALTDSDDAVNYLQIPAARQSGFEIYLEYESDSTVDLRLLCHTDRGDLYLPLGRARANSLTPGTSIQDVWNHNNLGSVDLGYAQFAAPATLPSHKSEPISVIIPVYNGMKYMAPLFGSLWKTVVPFKTIVVDDASPDENVRNYLDELAQSRPNDVLLLRNEQNLGFTGSINRGLEHASGHVVLVNTDVCLPDGWLERLIEPILCDALVASATPMTNSGTICSFPNFLKDNTLVDDLDVNEIDAHFRPMQPLYTNVPTGVGFCMAMSRSALDRIGALDAATFGRGYGEENDWCQRAIEAGFKNVIVENLFVFHNHGGSFQSEEKKRLCDEHMRLLLQKHPGYDRDVAAHIELNPLEEYRSFVHARIKAAGFDDVVLIFNHLLGGGADHFIKREKERLVSEGHAVATIAYSTIDGLYHYTCANASSSFQFTSHGLEAMLAIPQNVTSVLVNELASYPNISEILGIVGRYIDKLDVPTTYYYHDFLSICPRITLVSQKTKRFCNTPQNGSECERCYRDYGYAHCGFAESSHLYRKAWEDFLTKIDTIRFFSNSSFEIFLKAFPSFEHSKTLLVKPHTVLPLRPVDRSKYNHSGLRVGLLGMIGPDKGSEVVNQLLDFTSTDSTISITLIGVGDSSMEGRLRCTGEYRHDELPDIVGREEIDVFLLPSICPETFSYTCSEIIAMQVPILAFDLGAPAEHIAHFDSGAVVPLGSQPEVIVQALRALA